jgi:hypothetical protein
MVISILCSFCSYCSSYQYNRTHNQLFLIKISLCQLLLCPNNNLFNSEQFRDIAFRLYSSISINRLITDLPRPSNFPIQWIPHEMAPPDSCQSNYNSCELLPSYGANQSKAIQVLIELKRMSKLLESREQIWSDLRNDESRVCMLEEEKKRFNRPLIE